MTETSYESIAMHSYRFAALARMRLAHSEKSSFVFAAARKNDDFSSGVTRNRTVSVAGSAMGGLPRVFLGWFMAPIMWLQKRLDNPLVRVFNVATLNKEAT